MNSTKFKFVILLLIAGLLSACGGQAAEAPVSQPTQEVSAPTEAPTQISASATDTSEPATEVPAATEPAPAAGATVSFANEILPIIQSRCINCHGGDKIEEGLSMNTHAEIMAGSENGAILVPGDAASSLIIEMVASGDMPKRGPKLTPPQVQLIADWINQGALDN
ncbi:MAG TPA: c-type cytochrome domain-containing protein [Anaerolineales bacterium]|nr:c-type cytochrome domain-containing protein [Anaerolineales bacterium]